MKNKATTDGEDRLLARLVVYADLTRCFYYPDEGLVALFDSGEMEGHLPAYDRLGLDLKTHLDEIGQWRQGHKENGAALLDLKKEYTRLFISGHPKLLAPPYGSLYLEHGWTICGETTVDAVKLYVEAGLKISADFKDIPDHFAAEVEFVSYLIRERLKATGVSEGEGEGAPDKERASKMSSIEKKLLRNHLLKWAPAFLDRVMESTGSVFYREIARLSKASVGCELAFLDTPSTLK
ncbi:MAG: molecular chaperone TorD family protein [Desulfobacteria bacterium]